MVPSVHIDASDQLVLLRNKKPGDLPCPCCHRKLHISHVTCSTSSTDNPLVVFAGRSRLRSAMRACKKRTGPTVCASFAFLPCGCKCAPMKAQNMRLWKTEFPYNRKYVSLKPNFSSNTKYASPNTDFPQKMLPLNTSFPHDTKHSSLKTDFRADTKHASLQTQNIRP